MATRAQIAFHYDVDNDFYSLILDDKHRAYSCAVWDQAHDLDTAQGNKIARMCRYAGMQPGHRIVDVGCGWGGLMLHAVQELGTASAHGLTLSTEQFNYIRAGAAPRVSVSLQSWTEHRAPHCSYDAVVSIGAFEHFASREDRARNEHRQVYVRFFDWCLTVSTVQAQVGLQTIVTARAPRSLQELRDTRYLLENVFPGSTLPTVADIQAATVDRYEFLDFRRIGLDYARTLQCWSERLHANADHIVARYGDSLFQHFATYFAAAERSFRSGLVDLLQLSLRRPQAWRHAR